MNSDPAPHWQGRVLEAVLFDLDGTLMDTVADITLALNRALADEGLPGLEIQQVRPLIGRGAPILVERAVAGLGVSMAASALAGLYERFAVHGRRLQERHESTATLFPGVEAGLRGLHGLGLRVAVVTNKQQRLAADLIERWKLGRWVQAVVGGDQCARRKPDPELLLLACAQLKVASAGAIMVGDSINDVLAARAAGMPVICVPYGYNEDHDARELPCDALIESVAELPTLLAGANASAGAAGLS